MLPYDDEIIRVSLLLKETDFGLGKPITICSDPPNHLLLIIVNHQSVLH